MSAMPERMRREPVETGEICVLWVLRGEPAASCGLRGAPFRRRTPHCRPKWFRDHLFHRVFSAVFLLSELSDLKGWTGKTYGYGYSVSGGDGDDGELGQKGDKGDTGPPGPGAAINLVEYSSELCTNGFLGEKSKKFESPSMRSPPKPLAEPSQKKL